MPKSKESVRVLYMSAYNISKDEKHKNNYVITWILTDGLSIPGPGKNIILFSTLDQMKEYATTTITDLTKIRNFNVKLEQEKDGYTTTVNGINPFTFAC